MMKRKIGFTFFIAGLLLIAGSLGLFLYNRGEENRAAKSVEQVIPQMADKIAERQNAIQQEESEMETLPFFVPEMPKNPNREMPVSMIDGYWYIGCLTIPTLELELPIMTDWTYPQLQIAPCRYTGSLYTDDLVLMAHNYDKHFGRISQLRTGDTVSFTDMDGETVDFEVVALDVLQPAAIEEMTAGEYDLTLFTCTYGGQSRVTVRCDRLED